MTPSPPVPPLDPRCRKPPKGSDDGGPICYKCLLSHRRGFQQKPVVLTLGYIFKSFGEILKLLMPGCSPDQLHQSFSGWDPDTIFLPPLQETPACGCSGEPRSHNERRACLQAASATAETSVGGLARVDSCPELLTASGRQDQDCFLIESLHPAGAQLTDADRL